MPLDRYTEAQAGGEYERALAEIQSGCKTGHWIWYIFPQLAGLGNSSLSRRFGIRDQAEASAYIIDPVLGPRLLEIAQAVLARLKTGARLNRVMGSHVDALKIMSSMTLFEAVARRVASEGQGQVAVELARAAHEILSVAESQGYKRCAFTLESLR